MLAAEGPSQFLPERTEAGILSGLPTVSRPSPKCLQNTGRFRRIGANAREIQSICKWQEPKHLWPEVAPHQPVTRVDLMHSNPCLTAIRLRSRRLTRELWRDVSP